MNIKLNPQSALTVFFSYAHEDEALRDQLERHLSMLRNSGVITTWHDRKIGAGQDWARSIDEHLAGAQIVLLLISADFLASGYCWGVEMKAALNRHRDGDAIVIPIMLRRVDCEGAPFSGFQWLPEGDPVTSWSNRDEAFTNVAKGIRNAVNDLLRKEQQKTKDLLATSLNDPTAAAALAHHLAQDCEKQQVERWRILKETQEKIIQIQSQVTSGQTTSQEKMFKKWSEYLKS